MRVVHVSSEATWRGGEQQMAYLMEGLAARGVENLAVCRAGSAFADYCRIRGWAHHLTPFANALDPRAAWQLGRTAADVVHLHTAKAHGAGVLAATAGWVRAPLVVSRRVDFPVRDKALTRYKFNHRRVRRIVCVSDAIRQMVATAVARPERVVTVHSGVDPARFRTGATGSLRRELALPADVPLVGNTSALAPHKDYFTFLDVARRLADAGVAAHFLLIGAGPLEDELRRYASAQQLDGRVTFLGFRRDLPTVLPELDVFLMTSRTEGLGTSVLDAFAARVPVVATAAGGIPEMVQNERTGLLAPVGDATALAADVRRLLADLPLRERLTGAASTLLEAQFSSSTMVDKTLSVYREVMKEAQT